MKYYDEVKDIFERRRDDMDFIIYSAGGGGDTIRYIINNYVEEYKSDEDSSEFVTELNRTTLPVGSGISGDWMAHIRNFLEQCGQEIDKSFDDKLLNHRLCNLDILTSFFVDDEFTLKIGNEFGISNTPYANHETESLKDYLCSVSEQLIMWDTITRETTNKKVMISAHVFSIYLYNLFPNSKIISLIPGTIWWRIYSIMNIVLKNYTQKFYFSNFNKKANHLYQVKLPWSEIGKRLLRQWEKDGYILEGLLRLWELSGEEYYDYYDWDKLNKTKNLVNSISIIITSPYFYEDPVNWGYHNYQETKNYEDNCEFAIKNSSQFITMKDIIKTNTLAETLNVSEGGILQKKMTEWHNNNLKQFERYDISIDKMFDDYCNKEYETDIMNDRTKAIPFFNRK